MRDREEWARFLKERLEGKTLEPLGKVRAVSPMTKGKKGLVFLVEGDEERGVLRLYKDPLLLARTRKVYSLCLGAGVSVARIHFFEMGREWLLRGIWGISLEEWVDAWEGRGEAVLLELSRLHSVRRAKWGDPLWGRGGDWLEREMARVESRLERWARWRGVDIGPYREWLGKRKGRLTPLVSYSLVHGDLAPSNLGSRGEVPVLLDLDRAAFSHPLLDVVALIHHFPGMPAQAVTDYLSFMGLREEDLLFFTCLFHLKRLVRALKHWVKGEKGWEGAVVFHESALRSLVFN